LQYIRQVIGLKRQQIISPEELNEVILQEKRHIADPMGIRRLMFFLRGEHHIWVTRDSVWRSLATVDAEGINNRRRNRLVRRKFYSNGSNETWALDGFDKLARWGFAIHGGIDVYSRYLIWLRVSISNRDARYPLSYYLDAIEERASSRPDHCIILTK
jgi:hypothetical protein